MGLLDFAEGDPVVDAETHRAVLEDSEQRAIDDARDRLERMGVDGEQ